MKRNSIFLMLVIALSLALVLAGCGPKTNVPTTKNADGFTVKAAVDVLKNLDGQLRGGADGKCYSNMWELNVRAQSWLADKKNTKATAPDSFDQWVSRLKIVEPVCPSKGNYTMDNKGDVTCSVHGKLKTLEAKIQKAGAMTPGGADNAYKIATGKYVTPKFLDNLKAAYKLPASAAKVVDSYAVLNGLLYPLELSVFDKTGKFTLDGNTLLLNDKTKPIVSVTFVKTGGKWLMDNIVFSDEYLNKTTGGKK